MLVLSLLIALVIAVGSFWPPSEGAGPPGNDKVMHALAFATLTLPAALLSWRDLKWVVPAAIIYGAAIEVIQPSFGRSAEWLDFVADLVGIGCAVLAGALFKYLKELRK